MISANTLHELRVFAVYLAVALCIMLAPVLGLALLAQEAGPAWTAAYVTAAVAWGLFNTLYVHKRLARAAHLHIFAENYLRDNGASND